MSNILHEPARARHLKSLTEHISSSAHLARALWSMTENLDAFADERDRLALRELASAIADHASAALYIVESREKL